MRKITRRSLFCGLIAGAILAAATAHAQSLPKVAVTDLTYEEKVSHWFSYYQSQSHGSYQAGPMHESAREDSSVVAGSGEIVTIERGELHKFTGDIRGALIKSGAFSVIEGKPWSGSEKMTIYDIIGRIKQGYYRGADYVLFGTITSIESRNDAVNIQNTSATNLMLNMELVCDFSLIDTRTYQVAAGFTAMGEGRDAKLVNTAGSRVTLSRGRVMRDVSASLADNVLTELATQFRGGFALSPSALRDPSVLPPPPPPTMIYR